MRREGATAPYGALAFDKQFTGMSAGNELGCYVVRLLGAQSAITLGHQIVSALNLLGFDLTRFRFSAIGTVAVFPCITDTVSACRWRACSAIARAGSAAFPFVAGSISTRGPAGLIRLIGAETRFGALIHGTWVIVVAILRGPALAL